MYVGLLKSQNETGSRPQEPTPGLLAYVCKATGCQGQRVAQGLELPFDNGPPSNFLN